MGAGLGEDMGGPRVGAGLGEDVGGSGMNGSAVFSFCSVNAVASCT